MTLDAIRFRIMSQATEDFTGLWELAAAPQAPDLEELIAVLSGLIQERLIGVYRGTLFNSEETALAAPAARKEIRNKSFWDWAAPERGAHLRVFATPKGRDWYFAQRKPSADAGMMSR
jgi:hypothetical protein